MLAAGFLLALLRPSYFASLAGTDRFLLFRLLMGLFSSRQTMAHAAEFLRCSATYACSKA